jgi:flagellar motility protein MotE (MotC chaperone)
MADEKEKKRETAEKPQKEEKKKKKKKGDAEGDIEESPGKKGKAGKEKKEKKRHPAIKSFFVTCLVWLALLLTFAVFVRFDLFNLGVKETVFMFLYPEEDPEIIFRSEREWLEEFETDLDNREAELDEREFLLDDRESGLDDREYMLEEREFELEEKYPWVFDDSPQDIENPFDISSVAKAVAAMPPQRAANAMLGMDLDGALRLMNAMRPAEYGAILAQMSDEDAASFLDAMTGSD